MPDKKTENPTAPKPAVAKPATATPKPQAPKTPAAQKPKPSAKPVTRDEAKQPNLFGGEDEVYNVLQMQLTRVKDEIDAVEHSIDTKAKKRDELIDERSKIKFAISIMDKAAAAVKAEKGK